jgi:hypothetical protein
MANGYGLDTWVADCVRTGRFSKGVMNVALALYRRLITPRGTLRGVKDDDDEANYGFDVAAYVGKVGYESAINALPGLIRGELLKDDRVTDVAVSVTKTTGADGTIDLLIVIDVVLYDESENFSLTLSVDQAGTELLGVQEAA